MPRWPACRSPRRTEKKLGVCNLCEAICGLELTLTDGRVTGIRGNQDDPLSRGHICPKGIALADLHDDPDRLRRPMRRDGDMAGGRLGRGVRPGGRRPGRRDQRARRRRGRRSTSGNPTVHNLGLLTHGTALVKTSARATGSATSVDQLPHMLVGLPDVRPPAADADPGHRSDAYFLVLGAQPDGVERHAHDRARLPGPARALDARGGKMVVVDPRRTETAKAAAEHHFVRPGTDAPLLLAMVHVLFAEGLTRPPRAYVDRARSTSRPRVAAVHAGAGASGHRRRGRRDPADRARVRRPPTARRRTAGSACRRRSSARSPVG